ncbi:hypothetical protein J2Z21_003145 [Streptomyces griseochromogenes]|uniref:Uncharacterized protein n=1 Tax=Streptomyces griseochromogenes TaxID=68214 RepID=A0ABS4LSH5_9ACTN|nr:hypothetical protein [Streptomyces griseochromogenes]
MYRISCRVRVSSRRSAAMTTPEGRLQLSYRVGVAVCGDGRNALAGYDGSAWTALGEWTGSTGTHTSAHGSSDARGMYLHGIGYDAAGRLHCLFTGREQNDGGDLNACGEAVVDETRVEGGPRAVVPVPGEAERHDPLGAPCRGLRTPCPTGLFRAAVTVM